MKNKIWIITVILFLALSSGCQSEKAPETVVVSEGTKELEKTSELVVYVCGAVESPGVYHLTKGKRIQDAIELAGGFAKGADETGLNLAAILEDEMQLTVPFKEAEGTSKKVNLNTADKEELMTLSGVGESKAESILQYRKENGRFKKIEDVMEIPGIKEGMFEKIKDDITV